jgi:hypothetical protein
VWSVHRAWALVPAPASGDETWAGAGPLPCSVAPGGSLPRLRGCVNAPSPVKVATAAIAKPHLPRTGSPEITTLSTTTAPQLPCAYDSGAGIEICKLLVNRTPFGQARGLSFRPLEDRSDSARWLDHRRTHEPSRGVVFAERVLPRDTDGGWRSDDPGPPRSWCGLIATVRSCPRNCRDHEAWPIRPPQFLPPRTSALALRPAGAALRGLKGSSQLRG